MFNKFLIGGFGLMVFAASVMGLGLETIKLPKPQMKGGMPLMQALSERKSSREFSSKEFSPQMLSNLLWAAFGVNRSIAGEKTGKRTAPSACNWQEIDIYVSLSKGLYLYDAKNHILKPILEKDIRAMVGKQRFTKDAAVGLIYVADYTRMGMVADKVKNFYASTDTGFISQNVYLFCASENLATVVLGMVDRPTLSEVMQLNKNQKIILTQPVGFHKENEAEKKN